MMLPLSLARLPAAVFAILFATVCHLFLTPSAMAQTLPPTPEAEASTHGVNFQDTPLENVLELYGELTGKSVMLHPSVAQVSITFVAREELSARDAIIAIETLLGMNQVAILPFGEKFIRVQQVASLPEDIVPTGIPPAPGTLGASPGTPGNTIPGVTAPPGGAAYATAEPVLEVIDLKHMSFEEAQTIIQPFLKPYSKVQYIERTNSMLIYDTAAGVQRLRGLLNYADQPQEFVEETFIVQVVHAVASEIKATIDELVTQAQEDQQQQPRSSGVVRTNTGIQIRRTTPGQPAAPQTATSDIARLAEKGLVQGRVKVTADDRTNQLIILTRKENYHGFIRAIIERLDVPIEAEIGYRILRLEYADAEEIAGVLNDLIGNVTDGGGAGGSTNPNARNTTGGGQSLSDILRNRGGASTNRGNTGSRTTNVRPQSAALQQRAAEVLNDANLGQLGENTRIIADPRTNSILITGHPDDISMLDGIVGGLDMMLPQVLIEVAILEVNLNDGIDYGLDWLQRSLTAVNRETLGPNGGVNVDEPIVSFGGGSTVGGTGVPFTDGSAVGRDITLSAGGLTYFATFFDFNLDAILRLAASSSEARVISIPQILTTDNTDANVVIGESRPIPTASSTTVGGVIRNTFEYRDIGIDISLTPKINPNNVVVMEISASADNVGNTVVIDGNEVPIITRRSLEGEIAVKDGSTVALGGLVSEDERDTTSKIPFLGDIPIAGNLFKSTSKQNIRNELLVLITPKVLLSVEDAQGATDRLHGSTESVNARWDRGWSDSKYAHDPIKEQAMWRDRMHNLFPQRAKFRNVDNPNDVFDNRLGDTRNMRDQLGPNGNIPPIRPDVQTGRSDTIMFPGRAPRDGRGGLVGGTGFTGQTPPSGAMNGNGAFNTSINRGANGANNYNSGSNYNGPNYNGSNYNGSNYNNRSGLNGRTSIGSSRTGSVMPSVPTPPPGPPVARTYPVEQTSFSNRPIYPPRDNEYWQERENLFQGQPPPAVTRRMIPRPQPQPSVPAGPRVARTYPMPPSQVVQPARVIESSRPSFSAPATLASPNTPATPASPRMAQTFPVERPLNTSSGAIVSERSAAGTSSPAPMARTFPVETSAPAVRPTPRPLPSVSTAPAIIQSAPTAPVPALPDVRSVNPPRYYDGRAVTDPAVRDKGLPSPIPMR